MTMEHKLKKILQLVIDDQEDTENSEAMPNKDDIDKNVEEILKMLHTEVNDPTSSEKSFDKSELASRIDDFHKGCQAVHGRYDHLMGELKKILQPKSSDDGSLSVDFTSCDLKSDSGLDEFSDEREKLKKDCVSFEDYQILQGQLEDMKRRNKELETLCEEMTATMKERKNLADELAERVEVLTRDLDAKLNSLGDTNQMSRSLQDENEILRSDNAEAFSKIQEAEKHIDEFMLVNSALMAANEKQSGLIDRLNKEKEVLRSGNFVFINRIKKAEKAVVDVREKADLALKLVNEELRSQNSKLKAMEDLKAELEFPRDERSKLISINNKLNQELEAKVVENEALALEIKTMKDEYSNSLADYERMKLQSKNKLSLEEIGDLEAIVTDLKADNSRLAVDASKLVSEISTDVSKLQEAEKIVDKLKEDSKKCMLVEGEIATLNLHIRTLQDELTSTERISKEKEERNTQTIESLRQECGFIEEQVLKLQVGISGLSKAFSELEAVFKENSGHILEQISVFSEELKELKDLSAKYKEETISMMGDELAEKEKELADEDEKKREAIREMSLTIKHLRDNCDNLCKNLSCLMIERYRDDYNELRTFLSSP